MVWRFKHPSKGLIPSEGRLKGRSIVLAVTGSIAIIQAPELARRLMRLGAEVYPVMSQAAQSMLSPQILEWATGNKPVTEITGAVENIAATLGLENAQVDLVLVAPATANTVSKLAYGVNDSPVTGFALAALGAGIPVLLAPAMHRQLMANPPVKESLERAGRLGFKLIPPEMEEGKAKLASLNRIVDAVVRELTPQTLKGRRVMVTAGPTREPLDPIRVVTNRSSGRMGVALAREAWLRGGEVTLIYGPGRVSPPADIQTVHVETAREMFDAALAELRRRRYDVFIGAAAVADYTPEKPASGKISTAEVKELNVRFKATPKLVDEVKRVSPETLLVAFKAEWQVSDEELVRRALAKLEASRADLVVANDVSRPGAGFGGETFEALVVDSSGVAARLVNVSKEEAAQAILNLVEERLKG